MSAFFYSVNLISFNECNLNDSLSPDCLEKRIAKCPIRPRSAVEILYSLYPVVTIHESPLQSLRLYPFHHCNDGILHKAGPHLWPAGVAVNNARRDSDLSKTRPA